jgi:hypothetical protein
MDWLLFFLAIYVCAKLSVLLASLLVLLSVGFVMKKEENEKASVYGMWL